MLSCVNKESGVGADTKVSIDEFQLREKRGWLIISYFCEGEKKGSLLCVFHV